MPLALFVALPGVALFAAAIIFVLRAVRRYYRRRAEAEVMAEVEARRVRRRQLVLAFGLTDDEAERMDEAGVDEQHVPEWRRSRLKRLGAAMFKGRGLPGIVLENYYKVVERDPARAAAIIDDEDSFRVWVYNEGLGVG